MNRHKDKNKKGGSPPIVPKPAYGGLRPAADANAPVHEIAFCPQPTLEQPCIGEPDLFLTHLLFVGKLLFWCLMGGPFFALMFTEDDDRGFFIAFFLFCAGVYKAYDAVCSLKRVGGWFVVDAQGFRYGTGPEQGADRDAVQTSVAWSEIMSVPEFDDDVIYLYSGNKINSGVSGRPALIFWRRLPSGEIEQQRVLFDFTNDFFELARFRNHQQLMTALLYGFAARCPGLRFQASLFVEAAVDPRTWEFMGRPRKEERRNNAIGVGAMLGVIVLGTLLFAPILMSQVIPSGVAFILYMVSMAIAMFATVSKMVGLQTDRSKQRYPGLTGTLIFKKQDSVPSLTPQSPRS